MTSKTILISGAILAAIAVILGAFGAHALREKLPVDQLQVFETGVRYQFYHAFALLLTGVLLILLPHPAIQRAGVFSPWYSTLLGFNLSVIDTRTTRHCRMEVSTRSAHAAGRAFLHHRLDHADLWHSEKRLLVNTLKAQRFLQFVENG